MASIPDMQVHVEVKRLGRPPFIVYTLTALAWVIVFCAAWQSNATHPNWTRVAGDMLTGCFLLLCAIQAELRWRYVRQD